ncbi:MAG: putative rane protein [Herbinix sp.]|nr:putative rane protein [Herbinix sp.]
MDKKVEDKMVQQIEKNLHNSIDENLYLTGRIYDKDKPQKKSQNMGTQKALPDDKDTKGENPLVSLEYHNPAIPVSRAEYIRQARESCLRQLSTMQSTARAYDSYYLDTALQNAEVEQSKKPRTNQLFHEGSEMGRDEEALLEIAAFRFLIVRMVCALVIFLSIFLIDKFDFSIGEFSSTKIEEYVSGKDNMKQLEKFVITLLKEETE